MRSVKRLPPATSIPSSSAEWFASGPNRNWERSSPPRGSDVPSSKTGRASQLQLVRALTDIAAASSSGGGTSKAEIGVASSSARSRPRVARQYLGELAPRYWRITRARLEREQLDREVGWLTVPPVAAADDAAERHARCAALIRAIGADEVPPRRQDGSKKRGLHAVRGIINAPH